MKGFIAILFLISFACSGKITITEAEINPGIFYADGSCGPFTGKCSVVSREGAKVLEEFTYKGGRLSGEARIWYGNGRLKRKGSFSNGKLSGKWEYWDQDGKMLYEKTFHEDELVSTKYPSR